MALEDREAIMDYIAQDNPIAAINVDDEIERQADQLIEHPKLGRAGRVKGTRELVISGTPYIIAYQIDKESIKVIRVIHGAQQWPPSF